MRIQNLNEAYMNKERGTSDVSAEECLRSNDNFGEGNKLSILAFKGAFHGRTCASISCTNTPSSKIKVCREETGLDEVLFRWTHRFSIFPLQIFQS